MARRSEYQRKVLKITSDKAQLYAYQFNDGRIDLRQLFYSLPKRAR